MAAHEFLNSDSLNNIMAQLEAQSFTELDERQLQLQKAIAQLRPQPKFEKSQEEIDKENF
jgi:hypothetical protein